MTPAEFQQIVQKHGGLDSISEVDPLIDNPDRIEAKIPGKEKIENPSPRRKYTFRDGTAMEMKTTPGHEWNEDGTPLNDDYTVTDPGTAMKDVLVDTTPPAPTRSTAEAFRPGSEFGLGDDVEVGGVYVNGVFTPNKLANGQLSTRPKKVEAGSATTSETWIQDPSDASREVSGSYVNGVFKPNVDTSGKPITRPKKAEKSETPTFKEVDGKLYVWTPDPSKPGGGSLSPADIAEGSHPPGYFIEGGYKVYKSWNEGTRKYEVDPSQKPEAWSPEAQAQAAKTAAQPKENDTRDNIVGGYHVTQTYKGGEWTTTNIGDRATPREIQDLTAGTEQQNLVWRDEQGQVQTAPNPNYQGPKAPTTRGEIAQRVAAIQTQAAQMMAKIRADKSIPPDQQSARFSSWYDQNVAPQVEALDQQQQVVINDEAQKAIELQQKNLTAASTAMQGLAPYRVGPGYGQAFESLVQGTANTKFPGVENKPLDLGTGWSTYKAPSIDESAQQVLNARAPVLPGMDIRALTSRNQWVPGGPGGGGPAAPASGPTPEQLAAISAAGKQTAAASANPANVPFGAIGSNPMLAAMQARNRALASGQTAAATAQAGSPFGALNSMPRAGAMPMASGAGPLAYNPSAFSGVMPLLSGFDYAQLASQWQPTY